MALITYANKSTMNENASVPAVNKVQASDMNEIKSVVNSNWNALGDYVVESGTNYMKYDDGTMVCWDSYTGTLNITSSVGGIYYAVHSFTFPQTFTSAPVVIPAVTQGSGVMWGGLGNASSQTTTNTQLRVLAGTNYSNASVTFQYIAIGKWK